MTLDDYVVDVLMRDLVGHDHAPSAFLIYLHLWALSGGRPGRPVRASHQAMAEATGLSKSAVQAAVRRLLRRHLLRSHKDSPTAVPEYRVLRTWK
jgi:hypothetical protein